MTRPQAADNEAWSNRNARRARRRPVCLARRKALHRRFYWKARLDVTRSRTNHLPLPPFPLFPIPRSPPPLVTAYRLPTPSPLCLLPLRVRRGGRGGSRRYPINAQPHARRQVTRGRRQVRPPVRRHISHGRHRQPRPVRAPPPPPLPRQLRRAAQRFSAARANSRVRVPMILAHV